MHESEQVPQTIAMIANIAMVLMIAISSVVKAPPPLSGGHPRNA